MKQLALVLGLLLATALPSGSAWAGQSRGVRVTLTVGPGAVCHLPVGSRSDVLVATPGAVVIAPFARTVIVEPPPTILRVVPAPLDFSAPVIESRPAWIRGFWRWTGDEWVWVPDQWLRAGGRLGYWRWSGASWAWVPDALDLPGAR